MSVAVNRLDHCKTKNRVTFGHCDGVRGKRAERVKARDDDGESGGLRFYSYSYAANMTVRELMQRTASRANGQLRLRSKIYSTMRVTIQIRSGEKV